MAVVALYALLTAARLLTTCAHLLQTRPRRAAANDGAQAPREFYRVSNKGKAVC
jgi:hypothetical protein